MDVDQKSNLVIWI